MNCEICGKNLYQELDLRTLFKKKLRFHKSCEQYLQIKASLQVIPIEQNTINFHYLLSQKKEINLDTLFTYNMIYILLDYLESVDWSVIYFYDKEEYDCLSDLEKYLFLHLGQKPFVFISMYAY